MRSPAVLRAIEQRRDHTPGEPLASCLSRHGDLPDKKDVGIGWGAIARDPSQNTALTLCDNAAGREMRALQQVAIGRIAIERRTGGDQRGDSRPIYWAGPAEPDIPAIAHITARNRTRLRSRFSLMLDDYSFSKLFLARQQ